MTEDAPRPPAGRRLAGASRRAYDLTRSPAREELLEEAAEASRVGLRSRQERAVAAFRPILQTAVAAAAAWFIAVEVLGHTRPFFAPIAAVVTLGLTVGERRRRAIELAIGVAVGIAIADLLVTWIGTGTWQIGVTVALAMFAAILVGGGPLLASQAAASAVLVVALQPPEDSFDFTRAIDGLVGAVTGVLIGSLLLPADPVRMARSGAGPVLDSLASALDDIALAIEQRDERKAEHAIEAVAELRPRHDDLEDSVAEAVDAARMSLGRRSAMQEVAKLSEFARHTRLAIADARSLARGAGRAIAIGDVTPPEVHEAIDELAEATRELHALLDGEEPAAARERAVRAAALSNAVLGETANMSALHIVGQIRLLAVDLLRASGIERTRAQELVRGTMPEDPGGQGRDATS
jgi:uncharacterized membrane protein YgaE (UPF0421/DUF939 family)